MAHVRTRSDPCAARVPCRAEALAAEHQCCAASLQDVFEEVGVDTDEAMKVSLREMNQLLPKRRR